MKYITGEHALNLPCRLNTCGDWHWGAIQWTHPTMRECEGSLWGDYGIEMDHSIPDHEELYPAANHIRALLDLLYEQRYDLAQGMKNDFLVTDEYTPEVFEDVYRMRQLDYWNDIKNFMHKEYGKEWRVWLAGRENID